MTHFRETLCPKGLFDLPHGFGQGGSVFGIDVANAARVAADHAVAGAPPESIS
jgi:hypothetical protein